MYLAPSFCVCKRYRLILQLYHYLVYKVCVSALRQQLIAVCKQRLKMYRLSSAVK